jgi:hypothetical protein
MSKPASKSISVTFSPEKNHEFGIDGRGTSVLGKLQGDHVTAYGLVEMGFYRALSSLESEEVFELFKLENRNSLRERRGKVYDFISAIAALDTTKNAVSMYQRVDGILEEYNEKRHLKTRLRADTRKAQEDDELDGRNLKRVLHSIESEYKENGDFVRESLLKIVGLVMTFYNHIPNTAYFAIPEFEAGKDEGSAVRTSTKALDNIVRKAEPLSKIDSVVARNKITILLGSAVDNISNLIHFPEIVPVHYTDKKGKVTTKSVDEFLGEHRAETLAYGARTARARDNTEQSLTSALTKHMHITFATYPELEEVFSSDDIVNSFVRKVIGGRNGEPSDMGWPSFNNKVAIGRISLAVRNGLESLKDKAQKKHYTSYAEYDDLVSSDDEEESTKPKPRIAKPKAKALTTMKVKKEAITITEEEFTELQELRKLKAIVDAKEGVSFAVREEIKRECPTLYPAAAKGKGK